MNYDRPGDLNAGTTTDVNIAMTIMGDYAVTAPYSCPKSALILANVRNKLVGQLLGNPNFLTQIAAANSQVALALAGIDPRRAANLLSETGIVSREFDVAVVQVVQRWAAQSPPDTAAWVASSNNPSTFVRHGSNSRMTPSGANSNNNANEPSRRWATTFRRLRPPPFSPLPEPPIFLNVERFGELHLADSFTIDFQKR